MPVTSQNGIDEKKDIRKKDILFAGVMLTVYVACCVIFISGTFLWVREDRKMVNANAISTVQVIVTEKANTTATAIIRATEQAQYEFIDRFDTNINQWRVRKVDDEYWTGSIKIRDGVYKWEIMEAKRTFATWSDYALDNYMGDFDVYVDTKILDTNPGDVCSGFQFRAAKVTVEGGAREYGGYYFTLCSNGSINIGYHSDADGWERIATSYYSNLSMDWNRLEVIARSSNFKFLINGESVYEMDDERRKMGGLGLLIELRKKEPATILFDNFGLQLR